MSDMAKLQNEKHTNAEWRQLQLEREPQQGYSRRKHTQTDLTRFEDSYYAEQRSAKCRGRGTGGRNAMTVNIGAAVPQAQLGNGLLIVD
eukprot:4389307-Amphidinium_carterae.1